MEKDSINSLQTDIRPCLAFLRRAENLRKRRRKKDHTRTHFYKYPFKFLKTLFAKEKSGALQTTRDDLEEHLRTTHSDPRRYEHLAIPNQNQNQNQKTLFMPEGQFLWTSHQSLPQNINLILASNLERGSPMGKNSISPWAKWNPIRSIQEHSRCFEVSLEAHEDSMAEENYTKSVA